MKLLPDHSDKDLGGRDCVVIATMKIHGIRKVLAHDRSFQGVAGVKALDEIPAKV